FPARTRRAWENEGHRQIFHAFARQSARPTARQHRPMKEVRTGTQGRRRTTIPGRPIELITTSVVFSLIESGPDSVKGRSPGATRSSQGAAVSLLRILHSLSVALRLVPELPGSWFDRQNGEAFTGILASFDLLFVAVVELHQCRHFVLGI